MFWHYGESGALKYLDVLSVHDRRYGFGSVLRIDENAPVENVSYVLYLDRFDGFSASVGTKVYSTIGEREKHLQLTLSGTGDSQVTVVVIFFKDSPRGYSLFDCVACTLQIDHSTIHKGDYGQNLYLANLHVDHLQKDVRLYVDLEVGDVYTSTRTAFNPGIDTVEIPELDLPDWVTAYPTDTRDSTNETYESPLTPPSNLNLATTHLSQQGYKENQPICQPRENPRNNRFPTRSLFSFHRNQDEVWSLRWSQTQPVHQVHSLQPLVGRNRGSGREAQQNNQGM